MEKEVVKKNNRVFTGNVVSTKMNKSIVVEVDSLKWHKKYGKQYKSTSRYLVHDEKEQFKVGDTVKFIECRPLSKHKRWNAIKAE